MNSDLLLANAPLLVLLVLVALFVVRPLVDWIRGRTQERAVGPQPFAVREDKPATELFAPRLHEHPQYVTTSACARQHELDTQNRRDEFAGLRRQVELLGDKMERTLAEHNKKAEDRASLIHTRINNMAEPLNVLRGRFDSHVEHDKERRP